MLRTTAMTAIIALSLTGGAFAQATGGNNSNSQGLVNVSLGDVVVQKIAQDINVNVSQIPLTVQVPVGVAATVCGVDANVLAQQKNGGTATCQAANSSEALTQAVQKQIGTQK